METNASSAAPAAPKSSLPMDTKVVDRRVWEAFLHNFTLVQYLLDHNRLLLHEINLNQESKIPESLNRNVVLTRELRDNISKVADLYSKISDTCESLGLQLYM